MVPTRLRNAEYWSYSCRYWETGIAWGVLKELNK